jgi:hypothetical protein
MESLNYIILSKSESVVSTAESAGVLMEVGLRLPRSRVAVVVVGKWIVSLSMCSSFHVVGPFVITVVSCYIFC